jgi:hypothetical protein
MNFGGSRLGFWFNNSPFNITWNTSQTGIEPSCGAGGWYVTNQGLLIRYIIQDSVNCGGCNDNIQTGTATATISTGSSSYYFYYNLSGVAEYQNATYELMDLYLNQVGSPITTKLVSATGWEQGLGCNYFGPAQQIVYVNPPAILAANQSYNFILNFTTNDPLYHLNCYYECALNFQRI